MRRFLAKSLQLAGCTARAASQTHTQKPDITERIREASSKEELVDLWQRRGMEMNAELGGLVLVRLQELMCGIPLPRHGGQAQYLFERAVERILSSFEAPSNTVAGE